MSTVEVDSQGNPKNVKAMALLLCLQYTSFNLSIKFCVKRVHVKNENVKLFQEPKIFEAFHQGFEFPALSQN